MRTQSESGALPPPLAVIDSALRGAWKTQKGYLELRSKIEAWYSSLNLRRQPITTDWSLDMQVEFVDKLLTPDEQEAAAVWYADSGSTPELMLNEMLMDGYRVSFALDVKLDCVSISIVGKSATNPNRNLCLMTRHETVQSALPLAMYKHYVIYDSGSWGENSRQSKFG